MTNRRRSFFVLVALALMMATASSMEADSKQDIAAAIRKNDIKKVLALVAKYPDRKSFAFEYSVTADEPEVTQALLKTGVDPNAELRTRLAGKRPLWMAACIYNSKTHGIGSLQVAEVLLKAGADPNGPGDDASHTALDCALDGSGSAMVDLLIRYGAKPSMSREELAQKRAESDRGLQKWDAESQQRWNEVERVKQENRERILSQSWPAWTQGTLQPSTGNATVAPQSASSAPNAPPMQGGGVTQGQTKPTTPGSAAPAPPATARPQQQQAAAAPPPKAPVQTSPQRAVPPPPPSPKEVSGVSLANASLDAPVNTGDACEPCNPTGGCPTKWNQAVHYSITNPYGYSVRVHVAVSVQVDSSPVNTVNPIFGVGPGQTTGDTRSFYTACDFYAPNPNTRYRVQITSIDAQ